MKTATKIQITDLSAKWGLVTVMNPDHSIRREYRITAAEAVAVHEGKRHPPGCSSEEWLSGLVMVASRPCEPGMAVVNPNGTLTVNFGIREKAGRIDVSLMMLQPNEWEVAGGVVKIDHDVAVAMGMA